MGPFWNRFLTRWDLIFKIDVTVLKLAPVVDWFLAGDFPQGTTMPINYIPNMQLVTGLVRYTTCYWARGSQFTEIDGLGDYVSPLQ